MDRAVHFPLVMRTILLEQPGQFRLTDTPAPEAPRSGEALVRVRRIGVCGTDFHAFRGKQPFFTYPRILGHELGVEIVEVGANDSGLKAGDKCAVEPYLNCGTCIACRRGRPNCCERIKVLGVHADGGMREMFTFPAAKLHKSDKLSLEQLALVETLGIGAHAVARAKPEKDEFVLVVGAGPIGLSVIQFAQIEGAKVIVLDVDDNRLEFCRRQFDVHETLNAAADPIAKIKSLTGGDLPTCVFDATGNAASMAASFGYVANSGRLVFVGLFQGDVTFNDPDFHRREMTLLATRNSTAAEFKRIIALMESGRVQTGPWITHRVAFEQMTEQFPSWLDPQSKVIKAMISL